MCETRRQQLNLLLVFPGLRGDWKEGTKQEINGGRNLGHVKRRINVRKTERKEEGMRGGKLVKKERNAGRKEIGERRKGRSY